MRKLALVPALLGALLVSVLAAPPAGAASGSAMAQPMSCPSFRVLHNDRIGPVVLPAGSYRITPAIPLGLSCAEASKLFTRFLQDWDGVLPRPWVAVAQGRGKAAFKRAGVLGFSVVRSGGGEGEEEAVPVLGALCGGTFTVNASAWVGPVFFPRGAYLLYIPSGSAISCRRAAVLLTRFLGNPGGVLPSPWRAAGGTATFFRSQNPRRSAFRVEPLGGAGPR